MADNPLRCGNSPWHLTNICPCHRQTKYQETADPMAEAKYKIGAFCGDRLEGVDVV